MAIKAGDKVMLRGDLEPWSVYGDITYNNCMHFNGIATVFSTCATDSDKSFRIEEYGYWYSPEMVLVVGVDMNTVEVCPECGCENEISDNVALIVCEHCGSKMACCKNCIRDFSGPCDKCEHASLFRSKLELQRYLETVRKPFVPVLDKMSNDSLVLLETVLEQLSDLYKSL